MVVRRVLSDIVWGKEGSEEEVDGREEGPFTFRHYGGRREVMDGREEGPFRCCWGKEGSNGW